jgi:LysR family glycine cleavage system transcriptional activator
MKIQSPSLPELHAFMRAADSGSFMRAATLLCVTPAAVSRAVQRLEARVGVTLLERNARGVSLTASGRAYLSWIQPALSVLEDAASTSFQKSPQATLRISAPPTLNVRWLLPRLPGFQAEHPKLKLIFQGYHIREDFLRDDVDCWLHSRQSSTSRWPTHVQATYLLGREIVPICHPDLAHHIRKPADLLRFPLLYHSRQPDNWALWLRKAGVELKEPPLQTGLDAGLVEAVMAGMGVAVIQPCLIERELESRRIAAPIPITASTGRGYYFCTPRASHDRPLVADFRKWLIDQAKTGPHDIDARDRSLHRSSAADPLPSLPGARRRNRKQLQAAAGSAR